jgi:predicted nucleotidyltransferase
MTDYKQTLLRDDAYNQLVSAKAMLHRLYGKRITFSDVINLLVGKRLNLLYLPKEMQDYISAFVRIASTDESVLGILIFGSVARGTYNKYSDIDLLIVVKGSSREYIKLVHDAVQKANPFFDDLSKKGIYNYITPLVLGTDDLSNFSPLYASFAEEGITIFDRDGTIGRFLVDISKSHYSISELAGAKTIRWQIGS